MTAAQTAALAADREKRELLHPHDSHLGWLLLAVLTIIAAAFGSVRFGREFRVPSGRR